MKALHSNFSKRLLITLLSLISLLQVSAQTTAVPLRDFVIFGKQGVTIASSTIQDGAVGSNVNVTTTGGPTISGNLFSHGTMNFSNNTKVFGKVMAGPTGAQVSTTSFTMGTNGILKRNIYVNGGISIANTQVQGKVVQFPGSSYSGPALAVGQRVFADPGIPSLPVIAPAANDPDPATGFTGSGNLTNQQINNGIVPGQHGTVQLTGGKTLTFKGPGKYYFQAINNSGTNTLYFDFEQNSANNGGMIEIYVKGTVNLGKSIVNTSVNGSPGKVVLKVFGSGTAFTIAQGNSGGNQWQGTIYAYNGDINIGSGGNTSKVLGALYSNGQVFMGSSILIDHAPLDPCGINVEAGPDKSFDCETGPVFLDGAGKAPSASVTWLWTAEEGGVVDPAQQNSQSISVNKAGVYVLTITDNSCAPEFRTVSDFAVVTFDPCVVPGVIVPPDEGKINDPNDKIGSELNALVGSNGAVDQGKNAIFQLKPDDPGKVLIDIITKHGQTGTVYNIVTGTEYGLSDTIYNGPNSLILTGWFPVANLPKLNLNIAPDYLAPKISYVRPVYPALNNSGGFVAAFGDSAMGGGIGKLGYKLYGEGVKIGVLSDSYNNLNNANQDITARYLPGPANPINTTAVEVLKEYPYAPKTDEGRAMLQIIHEVAPKSTLSFRTGFITPGDFAEGIKDLASANCDIICDDITYITEPFFRPGVVAKAVSEVVSQGRHYVTAAGNFSNKSYESNGFTPSASPLPLGILGVAHDFGGSIYQEAKVRAEAGKPGIYTIVLQWEDEFYSLSNPNNEFGSTSDLDLYALDKAGNLIGFNRINIDGDPTEILTFVVNPKPDVAYETEIKLMVVRANGFTTPRFKFVIFRGNFSFINPSAGALASTIVGQGNVPEAVTVGAMRYNIAPEFKDTTLVVEAFSSLGGTWYKASDAAAGGASQKPDFVAPDGVNTSVYMGTDFNPEGDALPNFFGTSAAAPHAAGAIALLIEGKKRFQNDAVLSPAGAKALLSATTIDMYGAGFDLLSGAGLIRVDNALKTFANPTPYISGVVNSDPTTEFGTVAGKEISVRGNYFTSSSVVMMDGVALPVQSFVSEKEITAELPLFTGVKALTVYTPPFNAAISSADGGSSNTYNLNGINQVTLKIVADNKSKKYLEALPEFTSKVYKVTVDGDVLVTDVNELASYGLSANQISYTTDATVDAKPSIYSIIPARIESLDPAVEEALAIFYNYEYTSGSLTIGKLNVKITPVSKVVTYGDHIGPIEYNYEILDNVADPAAAIALLKATHEAYVASNAFAVVDGLTQAEVETLKATLMAQENKLSMMVSLRAILSARTFDILNNKLVLATDLASLNKFHLVDINKLTLQNYVANPGIASGITLQQTLAPNGTGGFISRAMVQQSVLNSNMVGVNGYAYTMAHAGFMQTLRLMENNVMVSRLPIFNNRYVHQINGITSGGSLVQFLSGGGGLVQFLSGAIVPVPDGEPVLLSDGSIVANANGGGSLVQFLSSDGLAIKITQAQFLSTVDVNGGGSLLGFISGATPTPVLSTTELYNYVNGGGSLLGFLSSGRILSGGGGLLGFLSGGGGLLQFLSGGGSLVGFLSGGGSLVGFVSAVVELNGGGSLLQFLSGGGSLLGFLSVAPELNGGGSLVGFLSGGGGLLGFLSGGGGLLGFLSGGGSLLGFLSAVEAEANSAIANSGTSLGLTSNTATIFDEKDAESGSAGPLMGISLVSGLTPGNHFILPGAFLNENFNVTNGIGDLLINKADQTITFGPLSNKTFGDAAFTISATSTSGLPVSFTVQGAGFDPLTNTITITGAGTVTVTASQAGDDNYNAATNVVRTFQVGKANQTITFNPAQIADKTVGDDPFTVTATASSGLTPVTLSIFSGPATISSAGLVTLTGGTGVVTIRATQAGNANYNSVTDNLTFTVNPDNCSITHSTFSSFTGVTGATTMWITVRLKMNGQLANHGDYVEFRNGTALSSGITPALDGSVLPKGRIEARAGITAPVTNWVAATNSWLTLIPPGYNTTSDIVISGGYVYSATGFKKGKNVYTTIKGSFRSNISFSSQWLFSMAAYQGTTFNYTAFIPDNMLVPVNGNYKSGTPVPYISFIVSGGTGSGGNNYTGTGSNVDALTACSVGSASSQVTTMARQIEPPQEKLETQVNLVPNPVRNQLTVSFVPAESGQSTLRMFSSNGVFVSEIFSGLTEGGQLYTRQVRTGGMRPGVYFVQLINQGQVITRKLVVIN